MSLRIKLSEYWKEVVKIPEERKIGQITHFYSRISVGIIELSDELKVGDEIRIKGHTSDFTQTVESMQIEHENVESAGKADVIGLKVIEPVRKGDEVFKVEEG